jgi:hypothetical protein
LRSSVIDSLLRFAARKYVDTGWPSEPTTKGGPQLRASTP